MASENKTVLGLIGPSSPCAPKALSSAVDYLESRGLGLKIPFDPSSAYGTKDHLFSCESAALRAETLTSLLLDVECSLVLSVRGGYGAVEMLPLLDEKQLSTAVNPFMGFSDSTALLNVLNRCGVSAYHGPSLSAFSEIVEDSVRESSFEHLMRVINGLSGELFPGRTMERLSGQGSATGELNGGNLSVLHALIGTPWQVDLREKILFFEEIGERPYRLHRMLLQMKLAGLLSDLRGVVIGRLTDCEHAQGKGPDVRDVLLDIFRQYTYPVLIGGPFGHRGENYPVPIGVLVSISSENKLELA